MEKNKSPKCLWQKKGRKDMHTAENDKTMEQPGSKASDKRTHGGKTVGIE